MTRQTYTCDDCGEPGLTARGYMLCCSPLNDPEDLNN